VPLLTAPLDDILSSRSKLRILRLLCTATVPLSGREVARRTGAQWRAVYLALQELVALGVVTSDVSRGQTQHQLNRSHRLVERALLPLFAAEEQWRGAVVADLRRCVEGAAGDARVDVRWAAIFGSTARGDDEAGSDLDLAVVIARANQSSAFTDALLGRARGLESRIGQHLSPTVLALSQLRRLHRQHSPLVKGWHTDSRRVTGASDLTELLGDYA
jgi:DNA-binding transcriptional ArsR family regulator